MSEHMRFCFRDDDEREYEIDLLGPISPLETFNNQLKTARLIVDEKIEAGEIRPKGKLRYLCNERITS